MDGAARDEVYALASGGRVDFSEAKRVGLGLYQRVMKSVFKNEKSAFRSHGLGWGGFRFGRWRVLIPF